MNQEDCLLGSRNQSQKGSVLIQVLIAAALAISVVLVLAQMLVMMNRMVSQAQLKISLFELRNNLLSTILSETAWKNTVTYHSNINNPRAKTCLQGVNGDTPPLYDCSGIDLPLAVVDGSNTVLLKATAPTEGYTRMGTACNNFDSANGNPDCPIHVQATWQTECVSPCNMRAPPLKITVSFQFNDPQVSFPINTDQLNFVLRR